MATVTIAGRTFQVLLSAELTRSGGRAEEDLFIPAVAARGGLLRRALWAFGNPIGESRSYQDVCLTDYVIALDHRFPGFLVKPPARNELSITTDQPGATFPIYGEGDDYGEGDVYGGTFTGSGEFVGVHDDRGHIYVVFRGVSVQLEPLTMEIGEYVTLSNPATAMLNGQDGKGYVLFGGNAPLAVRNTSTEPHTYDAEQDAEGNDVHGVVGVTAGFRTFISDPTTKQVRFTVDGFETLSGLFPVGPTDQDPNGMGAWSGFTFAGYDQQVSSFTEAGDPTPLLTTPLVGLRDDINGSVWVEQWGFNYTITRRGVFTVSHRDYALVGLNALTPFEGPLGGTPTAITALGESLLVAYLDAEGNTNIMRGEFDRQLTPGSGAPAWFSFDTIADKRIVAMAPTGLRPQPTLIAVAADGTIYWWEFGSRAREIADPAYQTGIFPGDWYGQTLMTEPNRVSVVRNARFRVVSGRWQLELLRDDGELWETAGDAVEEGYQIVDLRAADLRFHNLKPRLRAGIGEGQLAGVVEVEYLERPEVVEVRAWTLTLGADHLEDWAHLSRAVDPQQTGAPVTIETPEGDERTGWMTELSRRHNDDAQTQLPTDLVDVQVLLW